MSSSLEISVIIPTYNRSAMLPQLLESWRKLNSSTSVSYELIFSDDGSTDETVAVLSSCKDLPITLLANSHGGASAARNAAINAARGNRLLFLGDDIFPDENLLEVHRNTAAVYGEKVAILGRVDWHPAQKHNHLIHHITDVGNEQFSFNCLKRNEYTDFRHFYTCNISVSREILDTEKIKFDPRFYKVNFEDTELSYRLSKHGMKILYMPDALGLHYHEYTVEGFCKRQQTAGEMAVIFRKLHPEIDEIFEFHLIEDRYDQYLEINGLQTSDSSRLDTAIQRANEYENEIASGVQPNTALKKEILSVIYRQLFKLKFAEGLLSKKNNYDVSTANYFLYESYFGDEFYNALKFCGCNLRKVKDSDIFKEKLRNRDLLSDHLTVPPTFERQFLISQMMSVEGVKRLLKRSRTLRQLHEKLYGAKVQKLARNIEVEKPAEMLNLAVLVDEKLPGENEWETLESLGVSVSIIEYKGNRVDNEADREPGEFDALAYDYVYDLTGGKKSIRSWHIKNVALALTNRRYDYIIVSHSYANPPFIAVSHGFGNVVLSSELYLDHCSSIATRCGRVARLLPAPAKTTEEQLSTFLGCDQKLSITNSGLVTTKSGRALAALSRGPIKSGCPAMDFDKPVIFVITIFMAVGGAERNIIEVMRALKDKYVFVVITTERHSHELGSLHHQVAEFSNEIYDLAELAKQEDFLHLLSRLKSAYRPRALLVTNGSPWFLANSTNIRNLFNDLPVIDHQVYDQKAGWIHHYLDPGIQSFDFYVAINKKIESVMISEKKIPGEKIRQIYHAVNVDRIVEFKRAPHGREEILSAYQISPEKNVYIMIARLTEQKRPLDFLKLVSMRQAIDTNEQFVLIGDGPLRTKVDQFIRENRLTNITCLPYVDNPVALISSAKAMIFTSYYEGLPVAMLEALSLGVPVFSTDVGDIGLILDEYQAGAIFQPNSDIHQYNRCFSKFLLERENYASRLASNKDAIIERFCPRNIARQYDELFMTGLDKFSNSA